MSRKFLIGVMIIVAVIVGGAWEGYVWHRNRVTDNIQTVLSSFAPDGNVTYQTLEYSLFSNTLSVHGVVLGGHDAAGSPSIRIDTITMYKPDGYNMRMLFKADKADVPTMVPLAGSIVIEGIRGYRIGPYEISLGRLEISHLEACQVSRNFVNSLVSFFDAFEFDTITMEALEAKIPRESLLKEEGGEWNTTHLVDGYAYTARVAKIVFTDMEESLLKSLIMTGLQLSSEKDSPQPIEEKREHFREEMTLRLETVVLEGIKLESFQNLEKILKNKAEGIFPALQELVVGTLSLEGISVKSEGKNFFGPTRNSYREDSDLTIDTFVLTGLESGVLKALRIEGIDYASKIAGSDNSPPSQISYRQESMILEGINILQAVRPFWKLQTIFPQRHAGRELMTAVALEQMVSPFQADRTQISNARFESSDLGVVSLEKLAGTATYRDDTLVTSETTFMGLEWVSSSKDDFMQEMGYRNLSVSGRINDHFIPENKKQKLSFDMELKDAGTLALNLELGNYPRQKRSNTGTEESVMEGLEELFLIEMRLGRIELLAASMHYDDDTLFERFSAYQARKEGISPDAVNRELQDVLHRMFEDRQIPPALSQAEGALSSFLADPAALTFSMKPAVPVQLSDIEELTLENLLPLLNVSVTYEEQTKTGR